MPFTLPDLPYPANALEPVIDTQTMQIHHGKHHKAYVDNANKALEGTAWANLDPVEVIKRLAELPEDKRNAVRNNAGGHVNHTLFWSIMAPANAGGQPAGALLEGLKKGWGDVAHFKEEFQKAGLARFGSGWAWLCVMPDGSLQICSTANQDSPLMGKAIAGCDGTPILGCDVWEHAYYLKYQNRRADYLSAWWGVVNWSKVAELHAAALKR
ncbi:superoxide dismutase [Leptolyngbya sp. 15MV]|nr:superoxide dismutase [Leptolyngbya sp. 15MV]